MDIKEALRIDQLRPAGGAKPAAPAGQPGGSEFDSILQQLHELSASQPVDAAGEAVAPRADGVAATDQAATFKAEMQRADDDFVAAMDLRRQLEDAYRRYES